MKKRKFTVQELTVDAIAVALIVVLSRTLSIQTPISRISFGFFPVAFIALLYGPIDTMIVAIVADIIGALMFPTGPLFPPITVMAGINGFLYGLFLNTLKPVGLTANVINDVRSAFEVGVITTIFGNTFNIALMTYVDKGVSLWERYLALLPTRIIQFGVMLPIHIFAIIVVRQLILPRVGFLKPHNAAAA